MLTVLSSVSEEYEVEQCTRVMQGHARQFRILNLVRQEGIKQMQTECWESMSSPKRWAWMNETEVFRTTLFKLAVKPVGVCWMLVKEKYHGFPWLLFLLLEEGGRTLRNADWLLSQPTCVRDPFATYIFDSYPGAHDLISEECFQLLALLGTVLQVTTLWDREVACIQCAQTETASSHPLYGASLPHGPRWTCVASGTTARPKAAGQVQEKVGQTKAQEEQEAEGG